LEILGISEFLRCWVMSVSRFHKYWLIPLDID